MQDVPVSRCLACRYHNLDSMTCPECGRDESAQLAFVRRKWTRVSLVIGLALALPIIFTACRIEWLNHRAGGVLPQPDLRATALASEPQLRQLFLLDHPDRASRDLTPEEELQLRMMVDRAVASNQLLRVLGSWGCTQFLLVPALLVFSATVAPRGDRRLALALGGVAVIAGLLMFFRGYLDAQF